MKLLTLIIQHGKKAIGSGAMLGITYLWFFNQIDERRAVFGLILLAIGGFIDDKFDLFGLFRYLGKYKRDNENNNA